MPDGLSYVYENDRLKSIGSLASFTYHSDYKYLTEIDYYLATKLKFGYGDVSPQDGLVRSVTYNDNTVASFGYNALGLKELTSQWGLIIDRGYEYDGFGRLVNMWAGTSDLFGDEDFTLDEFENRSTAVVDGQSIT
ncbi:hypothetical protein [Pseudodesulfovibrio indicus]|uniref:hypothetical protein n=1 Tax=Pseudodesulfovibrio indicus TaxID=1716143 RepID=UPI00292FB120|nr:hypothetical protein [Pseudodesulfovibrio indicus]